MVKIDIVTTRGGDKGRTSLGDGTRLPKHAPRIAAIGAMDEANATIGLLRLHAAADAEADAMLARIQNEMFDLGADLCLPGEAGEHLRFVDTPSARLEAEIAAMNAGLAPLRSFVLPGGCAAAAHAHLARTVVRRAERAAVELAEAEAVNPAVIRYLNRLSDHLFVMSRRFNAAAGGDVLWQPGATR